MYNLLGRSEKTCLQFTRCGNFPSEIAVPVSTFLESSNKFNYGDQVNDFNCSQDFLNLNIIASFSLHLFPWVLLSSSQICDLFLINRLWLIYIYKFLNISVQSANLFGVSCMYIVSGMTSWYWIPIKGLLLHDIICLFLHITFSLFLWEVHSMYPDHNPFPVLPYALLLYNSPPKWSRK